VGSRASHSIVALGAGHEGGTGEACASEAGIRVLPAFSHRRIALGGHIGDPDRGRPGRRFAENKRRSRQRARAARIYSDRRSIRRADASDRGTEVRDRAADQIALTRIGDAPQFADLASFSSQRPQQNEPRALEPRKVLCRSSQCVEFARDKNW